MAKTMVQYLITGTTDKCLDEMLTTFDPQVLEATALVLENLLGVKVTVIIDDISIVEIEDLNE